MIDKNAVALWNAVSNMIDAIGHNMTHNQKIDLVQKACDAAVDVVEIGITGGLSSKTGK